MWILDHFAKSYRGWILLIPCFADLVDNSSVIRGEELVTVSSAAMLAFCVTTAWQMSEIGLKDLKMTWVFQRLNFKHTPL